ncbi:hypothetical protein H6L20_04625 [Staphylococcus epidermidis]|uniref:hypothetical protein n=1 Tax=Staphylococcus epidermidis TaxID=1282 RepID=UPI00193C70F2|nr:hypothetical protein [Staphylococcus epidermidis]MBM6159253.1 hypothetical protein [Staphylococcus epidermidis]MBM6161398.1 hypothetical protein [Staphylococcus epidermidis]MBM6170377.1 hypothetical protein [Staphylococcus epidermidis]MBM6177031.1 hypothetical protein [Staphylococcus epidermidis]MBM6179291.1 hypothetical protein [Staphylococcus epidermidis]
MSNFIGSFNMPKQQLKELSDAKLAMHFTYMEERFKQLNKIKFNCKLPLGRDEYEILTVPSKTQKEFKNIFRQVMKDKIAEAHNEFVKRNIGTYETNVKEVLGK